MEELGKNPNINQLTDRMDKMNANIQKMIQNVISLEYICTVLTRNKCEKCEKMKNGLKKAIQN